VKTFLAAVFMLIASAAANSAQASAVAVPCNACTSVEASQVARSKGQGIHYVYDFFNETLRKYEVYIERDLIPGQYTTLVDELPVEAGNANYFAMLLAAKRDFGNISSIVVPITVVPGDTSPGGVDLGTLNAGDILRSSQNRNALFDFILAQQNVIFSRAGLPSNTSENLVGLLKSLDKVFTQGELLNVTLKLTFSDGSRITLTLGDGGTVTIIPRTAIDKDGNSIPDANVVDFAGEFTFSSGSSRDDFVSVARLWGISFSTGNSLKFSCAWDGVTLSCKPI
jgi:hypothetical protein